MKKLLLLLAMAAVTAVYCTQEPNAYDISQRPDEFPLSIQVGDLSYTKYYQFSDSLQLYAKYTLDNVRSYPNKVLSDGYLIRELRKDLQRRFAKGGVEVLPMLSVDRFALLWETPKVTASEYRAKKMVRRLVKSIKEER